MSYHVTMKADAKKYEAAGHFDCLTTRLHNPEEVNDGSIVMGLTHFLPQGGSQMAPAKFEMVYFCKKGEVTVTVKDDAGKEESFVLKEGDSIHFGPGTERGILNTGLVSAQLLVIMIKK